ncbi:MAG: NUDIX domain-containing protein [Actinobacteria bacterium]|nr:NUDIX domain-containing protein [Actinomycetota bacterium]MBI3686012.1 NUDIX domain-containing protein [Actinomycetota bacterium]
MACVGEAKGVVWQGRGVLVVDPVWGCLVSVKHATAGAFVFSHLDGRWRLGLVEHPRLGRRMIPGGHVEDDETQAQAALREVEEESGLVVRLIDPPGAPLPAGFPHPQVASPWWITEVHGPADNHLDVPHVHVDHQYVAVADDPRPVTVAVHPFA